MHSYVADGIKRAYKRGFITSLVAFVFYCLASMRGVRGSALAFIIVAIPVAISVFYLALMIFRLICAILCFGFGFGVRTKKLTHRQFMRANKSEGIKEVESGVYTYFYFPTLRRYILEVKSYD